MLPPIYRRSIDDTTVYGWLPTLEQFHQVAEEAKSLRGRDQQWFDQNQRRILLQLIRIGFYRWYLPQAHLPLRSIVVFLDNWHVLDGEDHPIRCIGSCAYLRIKAGSWYDQYRLPHWMYLILRNDVPHDLDNWRFKHALTEGWNIVPGCSYFLNLDPRQYEYELDVEDAMECQSVCDLVKTAECIIQSKTLLASIRRPYDSVTRPQYPKDELQRFFKCPLLETLVEHGWIDENVLAWRDLAIGERGWTAAGGWSPVCRMIDLNNPLVLYGDSLWYERVLPDDLPLRTTLQLTKLSDERALLRFPAYYPFEANVQPKRRAQLLGGVEVTAPHFYKELT